MSIHRACCCGADVFAATTGSGGSNLYGISEAGATKWIFNLNPSGGAINGGALSSYGRMGVDDECVYLPMARVSTWSGSGGANASVLAVKTCCGTLKWSFDTGSTAFCTYALGDGTVLVGGARSNSWTGATGFATLWKLSSSGAVVWSYDNTRAPNDVVVDQNGNIFTVDAGAPAQLTKLDSSGTFVANNAAVYPAVATQYAVLDTDTTGAIYATFATGGVQPENVVAIGNGLNSQLWIADSGGGANRAIAIRAMNVAVQYAMVTNNTSGWRQVYGGTVGSAIDTGSGDQWGMDLRTETGGLYGYVGGSRTTSWLGSGGATANLVKAICSTASFPPSSCEWGVDLNATSNQERVVRVAAQKHWNAS